MRLEFELKGKDWIGLYLSFLIFYFGPNIGMQILSRKMKSDPSDLAGSFLILLLFCIMVISALILFTPLMKIVVNNVKIGNDRLVYTGKIKDFLLLNTGNLLLSFITLGIYFPWYVKKLTDYIVKNIIFKEIKFIFAGRGLHLFGLLIVTLLIPMILYITGFVFLSKIYNTNRIFTSLSYVLVYVLMVPYCYYCYKWMVNIVYKNYKIRWSTSALSSMMVILRELCLTIITVFIYWPVAFSKLYQYFINRTVIEKERTILYSLKVKLDFFKVWKTIWGQVLLTIITFGIYGAWAYCNIIRLFINSTSIEKEYMMVIQSEKNSL